MQNIQFWFLHFKYYEESSKKYTREDYLQNLKCNGVYLTSNNFPQNLVYMNTLRLL
jgi:hypothetical protein